MRTRNVRLMLLAAAFVAVVRSPAVTASSPQTTAVSYSAIVEAYRRGDDDVALKQLGALTDSDITRGRDGLLAEFDFSRGESAAAMVRAAALLHTVRAFVVRAHENVGEFKYQFNLAQIYIERLVTRERQVNRRVSPFVETWRLLVIASYHGQMGVMGARDFSHHERDPGGDSALFLLALGATEEMGWSLHQEEDAPPFVNGDLKDAERDYRQALIMSPDLVEARLRLGRVLGLRQDDEAAKMLEQIGNGIEPPYQYLARLFEGDLFERTGNLAEAERQYRGAVELLPSAQSAFMALAHVRHAQGARAQAAQDVRVTTGARAVPDTADPWFWYARGTAWRGPGYLDDLRRMIAP